MTGTIVYSPHATPDIGQVVLSNPGKLNAIDVSMWHELREVFVQLQAIPAVSAPRAVIVSGSGGQFASGGDIHEFATFRFDEDALRHFHEDIVAPALQAVLDCDIPLLAQIDGACIGGGLEIAACCDIRICGTSSRFGAPIAKLGFPMAPGELEILHRVVPGSVLREMLLEARLLNAHRAFDVGLVHAVVEDGDVARRVLDRAEHVSELSTEALRINKRSMRQLSQGGPDAVQRRAHFDYAPSAEHREGVMAFIEKRPPKFTPR